MRRSQQHLESSAHRNTSRCVKHELSYTSRLVAGRDPGLFGCDSSLWMMFMAVFFPLRKVAAQMKMPAGLAGVPIYDLIQ